MKTIVFNNIEGALGGGPNEMLRVEVTREAGHYILIVSRNEPGGKEQTIVNFPLTHSEVERIADLAKA
jgi:hypothetical protein